MDVTLAQEDGKFSWAHRVGLFTKVLSDWPWDMEMTRARGSEEIGEEEVEKEEEKEELIKAVRSRSWLYRDHLSTIKVMRDQVYPKADANDND